MRILEADIKKNEKKIATNSQDIEKMRRKLADLEAEVKQLLAASF